MPPQAPYGAPMGTPPSGQTNTGMLVWSIITIFFCTILGVIALIMTVTAKNELTGEGEQKKLKTAKTLNLDRYNRRRSFCCYLCYFYNCYGCGRQLNRDQLYYNKSVWFFLI